MWIFALSFYCYFRLTFFSLIILLKSNFVYWSGFTLYWVDKVTDGTKCFESVVANFVVWSAAVDKTQFADQVRMRLISKLINDISEVFQKLL